MKNEINKISARKGKEITMRREAIRREGGGKKQPQGDLQLLDEEYAISETAL